MFYLSINASNGIDGIKVPLILADPHCLFWWDWGEQEGFYKNQMLLFADGHLCSLGLIDLSITYLSISHLSISLNLYGFLGDFPQLMVARLRIAR